MAEAVKQEAITPAQQEVDTWLTALDKALTSDTCLLYTSPSPRDS